MNAETQTAIGQQYLTFVLDEELYAFSIQHVREVLEFRGSTRVPLTPEYMRGVINLRGSVVPVVDLRVRFQMSPTPQTVDTCVVVVELTLDGEGTQLGVLTDAVQEVLELSAGDIHPPPRIGSRLQVEFIQGMGRQGEAFVTLLDLERIFSSAELEMVASIAESIPEEKADV
jgi:purine-binding chemotaxis protein CheW